MSEPQTGPVTEYAVQMSGGGMHVRNNEPYINRIFPLAEWIASEQRFGGKVWRRRVVVVEDWTEVTSVKAASAHGPQCSGWTKISGRPDPDRQTVTAATCEDCGEQVGTITLTPMGPPSAGTPATAAG